MVTDPFVKLGKRLRDGIRRGRGQQQLPGRGDGGKRDVYALKDVSTVLDPSKLYLVIGGPKSGKTSFLKAIAGRWGVSSGHGSINGISVQSQNARRLLPVHSFVHMYPPTYLPNHHHTTGRAPRGGNVQVSGSVLYNGERTEKDAGFNITRACVRPSVRLSVRLRHWIDPPPPFHLWQPDPTDPDPPKPHHHTDVACYVEETDNNEPLLTVRETLEFAGTCILPVPTQRLCQTPWFELLVEKLELDEATKQGLLKGKNVGSLKVKKQHESLLS